MNEFRWCAVQQKSLELASPFAHGPSAACMGVQVQACKRNMNTFAFVGNLNENPEVSCVYHSEEAENQFLKDPKRAKLGDGYAPPPAAQE